MDITIILENGITIKARPCKTPIINKNITTLNSEACLTCQFYKEKRCINNQKWSVNEDFICDDYKRKRSGAYRRKRAKYNKR